MFRENASQRKKTQIWCFPQNKTCQNAIQWHWPILNMMSWKDEPATLMPLTFQIVDEELSAGHSNHDERAFAGHPNVDDFRWGRLQTNPHSHVSFIFYTHHHLGKEPFCCLPSNCPLLSNHFESIWNQFRWERFSGTEDIIWTNIPWGLVTVTLMTLRAASQNWHTIPWLMHGDAPQYQSLLQKVQKSRRYQIWIWTHLGKVHCAEDPYVAASVLLLADLEDSHQVTIGKATHHRPAKHTRPQLCHLHLSVTLTVSPSSEKKIAWILFSTSTIWALELDGFVFRNKILPDSGFAMTDTRYCNGLFCVLRMKKC